MSFSAKQSSYCSNPSDLSQFAIWCIPLTRFVAPTEFTRVYPHTPGLARISASRLTEVWGHPAIAGGHEARGSENRVRRLSGPLRSQRHTSTPCPLPPVPWSLGSSVLTLEPL